MPDKPRYSVIAGRVICLDGEPLIHIAREGKTAPVVADDYTRVIAQLLNMLNEY